MCKKILAILVVCSSIISNVYAIDPADVVPPLEYVKIMTEYNKKYFHFTRLDLVIRLVTWESNMVADKATININGTTDLGLSALNSRFLLDNEWNYVEQYWKAKKEFRKIPFDWKNPRHNLFIGMSIFNNCLKYTGNYFDAIVAYNAGIGSYDDYIKNNGSYILKYPTKNELEFIFQKEYWSDNMNYHYMKKELRPKY
jgi:hypothetical protein